MNAICIGNEGNCSCYKTLTIGKTYQITRISEHKGKEFYRVRGCERGNLGCFAWYWAENFIPVQECETEVLELQKEMA